MLRKFQSDHRDKPKLHQRYVAYALEELRLAQEAYNNLTALSRVSASAIANALWNQVQDEILNDAAWFEAAALLFAHADTSKLEQGVYAPAQEEESSNASLS